MTGVFPNAVRLEVQETLEARLLRLGLLAFEEVVDTAGDSETQAETAEFQNPNVSAPKPPTSCHVP